MKKKFYDKTRKRLRETYIYAIDSENTVPRSDLYDEATELDEVPSCLSGSPFDQVDTFTWGLAYALITTMPKDSDVVVFESTKDEDAFAQFIRALDALKSGFHVFYFHNLAYDVLGLMYNLIKKFGYKKCAKYVMEENMNDTDTIWIDENETAKEIPNDGRYKRIKLDRNGEPCLKYHPGPGEFKVCVNGMGVWYSLEICTKKNKRQIKFVDSLKLLPFSVEKIGKEFECKYHKQSGTIDYAKTRRPGYKMDVTEKFYLKCDVLVMAEALAHIHDFHVNDTHIDFLRKLTIGSNCLEFFVSEILGKGDEETGKKIFDELFPSLTAEEDAWFREAYAGGWVYNNTDGEPIDLTKDHIKYRRGRTYDRNSMYPAEMFNNKFPVGKPHYFNASEFYKIYGSNKAYYVKVKCRGKLKDRHFPFIKVKRTGWNDMDLKRNDYIRDIDETTTLTFAEPDFELFLESYDFNDENGYFEVLEGFWFDSGKHIFDKYISFWYELKATTTNPVVRQVCKLELNNLYGKFSQNPVKRLLTPRVDEDGMVRFDEYTEVGTGGYIPIGAYITAYARKTMVTVANINFDRFCYSDTDSIHLLGMAFGIKIHATELGAWKCESRWDKARFLRAKTYVEHLTDKDGKTLKHPKFDIKACGCPKNTKDRLLFACSTGPIDDKELYPEWTFKRKTDETPERSEDDVLNRFCFGLKEAGKLSKHRVRGGVVLRETCFSINES